MARKAQNIWAQILVLSLEQGSLPLQVLVPPSVNSENLMEEQNEQTPGHAWPSAGFSCSKRPMATEAAICCKDAVGSTSLGQARMLAEGPTLTGNCPAIGEGDTLTGESPILTLLHLGLVLLYLPLCLSPLQSESGPAATLHKALIYRRQR